MREGCWGHRLLLRRLVIDGTEEQVFEQVEIHDEAGAQEGQENEGKLLAREGFLARHKAHENDQNGFQIVNNRENRNRHDFEANVGTETSDQKRPRAHPVPKEPFEIFRK